MVCDRRAVSQPFILYCNLSSYVSLVLQLIGGTDGTEDKRNVPSKCDGFNLTIFP